MELEGTLILERPASRRWLSVVSIVVPIFMLTGGAAWFIRAYVAPPMAPIAVPTAVASAPHPASTQEKTQPPAAPTPSPAAVAKAAQPAAQPEAASPLSQPAASLPMFASLAAAPPALNTTTSTVSYADPIREMPTAAAPVAHVSSAGPVPLPRQRPHDIVALVTGTVPLPRARPAERSSTLPPTEPAPAQPTPSLPAFDRHTIE
jgi:hypothetical protein